MQVANTQDFTMAIVVDKTYLFSDNIRYVEGDQDFPVTTLRFGGGSASTIEFTIKDLRYGIGGLFQIPTLNCEFEQGFSEENENCLYCPVNYIRDVETKGCTT
jgi:hypothetical protein